MSNQSKIGITLFIEMWPSIFYLYMKHWEDGNTNFFSLRYNLITPTLCNDINISSCVDYVLVYDAKSKAIFLNFDLNVRFIFTTCLQLHTL